jgi:hypothetical protein
VHRGFSSEKGEGPLVLSPDRVTPACRWSIVKFDTDLWRDSSCEDQGHEF